VSPGSLEQARLTAAAMKPIPDSEKALVLRTDFSSQSAWEAICREIRDPVDGFHANMDFEDFAGAVDPSGVFRGFRDG
jgi:hypothetical protein